MIGAKMDSIFTLFKLMFIRQSICRIVFNSLICSLILSWPVMSSCNAQDKNIEDVSHKLPFSNFVGKMVRVTVSNDVGIWASVHGLVFDEVDENGFNATYGGRPVVIFKKGDLIKLGNIAKHNILLRTQAGGHMWTTEQASAIFTDSTGKDLYFWIEFEIFILGNPRNGVRQYEYLELVSK